MWYYIFHIFKILYLLWIENGPYGTEYLLQIIVSKPAKCRALFQSPDFSWMFLKLVLSNIISRFIIGNWIVENKKLGLYTCYLQLRPLFQVFSTVTLAYPVRVYNREEAKSDITLIWFISVLSGLHDYTFF